jgi:hypothetical protein
MQIKCGENAMSTNNICATILCIYFPCFCLLLIGHCVNKNNAPFSLYNVQARVCV